MRGQDEPVLYPGACLHVDHPLASRMNPLNESVGDGIIDDRRNRLFELLISWEDAIATGNPLTAAQLCADCPEFIPDLEHEILLLRNFDRFVSPAANFNSCETLADSNLPTAAGIRSFGSGFEIPGFEILEELGRGGMSVVYKARQKNLKRFVAIKTLAGNRWAQPGFVVRLRQEAKALSQLNDPHVVQVFDIIDTPSSISLVLEYVDGGSLAARLKGMPLSPTEAARIALTLALTMSIVHQQGIFHRDIKPANVLIDRAGEIKIADFGLAKEEGSTAGQTVTGEYLGTPSYMAPEQARGLKREVDPRTDVYAIGATLYEMLTGRPPFSGASTVEILNQVLQRDPIGPRLIIPGIPRDVETICLKCLEKESKKRFESAQVLASELDRFLKGTPILSRSTGFLDRFAKWCKRRPALALFTGFSFAATVAITLLLISNLQNIRKYNQDLVAAGTRAIELQRIAEENERRAKDGLYASNISRAAVAWKQGNTRESNELLERLRPGPGEVDRRGFEWWFLHRQVTRPRRLLLQASGAVYLTCYTPDRKWLVVLGKEPIVRFLHPDTGTVWKEFPTGQSEVNGVAFSPDGTEFATAGDDGTIRIWAIETGHERLKISTPYRKVFELAYTRDGTRIISCGISPVIHIFDVHSGEGVAKLEGHFDVVESIGLSDDGQTLVSKSNDNTVRFWRLDGSVAANRSITAQEPWETIAYDQKRDLLIAGNEYGVVRTIRILENREVDSVKQIGSVSSLAIHPDGLLLAIGGKTGQIRLRRLDRDGRFVEDTLPPWQGHQGKIYSLHWSADNSRLISAGKDGRVLSWSLSAAQRIEPKRFALCESMDPSSTQLVSSLLIMRPYDEGRIRQHMRSSNSQSLVTSISRYPHGFFFSCDGRLAARIIDSRTLQLFSVPDDPDQPTDAHLLAEWKSPGKLVAHGFAPDSRSLAATVIQGDKLGEGEKTQAILFSVPRLERAGVISVSMPKQILFLPDGKCLAVVIPDEVILWDNLAKKRIWTVPQANVLEIAISPNGKLVVMELLDRTLVVRNTIDGELVVQLQNLETSPLRTIFSPDNRTLVRTMPDKSLVFTHIATGQDLLHIEDFGKAIPLGFSDRGRILVCRMISDVSNATEEPPDELVVLDGTDPETSNEDNE